MGLDDLLEVTPIRAKNKSAPKIAKNAKTGETATKNAITKTKMLRESGVLTPAARARLYDGSPKLTSARCTLHTYYTTHHILQTLLEQGKSGGTITNTNTITITITVTVTITIGGQGTRGIRRPIALLTMWGSGMCTSAYPGTTTYKQKQDDVSFFLFCVCFGSLTFIISRLKRGNNFISPLQHQYDATAKELHLFDIIWIPFFHYQGLSPGKPSATG
jgi:hypothetical protein